MKDYATLKEHSHLAIGLRVDVDHDIDTALKMAKVGYADEIYSTFFVLHTAPYYKDKGKLLARCLEIQELGNEIGFHNDIVTAQAFQGLEKPIQWFKQELEWFRINGIKITGISQHGNKACRDKYYLNDAFWKNFNPVDHFTFTDYVNGKRIERMWFEDSGLEYNTSQLPMDFYYSDCQHARVYSEGWFEKFTDFSGYDNKSKGVILTHPIYYQ
jgi:hypothetical protein